MINRYVHEYVDYEVSEIIDTVEKESLTAERIVELLNSMDKKIVKQDNIIRMQEMSICELSNNLTAIRKWGIKAPCFDGEGKYVEENVPNLNNYE